MGKSIPNVTYLNMGYTEIFSLLAKFKFADVTLVEVFEEQVLCNILSSSKEVLGYFFLFFYFSLILTV